MKGKKNISALGGALAFRKDPIAFFKELDSLGTDIVNFRLLTIPSTYVASAEAANHVLITNYKNYEKGGIFFETAQSIFGNGLVFSNGEFWARQRRIMNPLFHRAAIQSYYKTMAEKCDDLVAFWQENSLKNRVVDAHKDLNELALEVVTSVLFGASLSQEEKQRLLQSMHHMLDETQRRTKNGVSLPFLDTNSQQPPTGENGGAV
ncbi:MAG: cytochrome P450 [Cytophagales bacterium]|nr:cytochrome P450 [Cytophagales bacterium]